MYTECNKAGQTAYFYTVCPLLFAYIIYILSKFFK